MFHRWAALLLVLALCAMSPKTAAGQSKSKPRGQGASGLGSYPNPFNPVTNIYYNLPKQTNVKITVYNTVGSETAILVNGLQNSGRHLAVFDGENFSSGTAPGRFLIPWQ